MRVLVVCSLLLAMACGPENPERHYQTVDWNDLLPDDDMQALLNPSNYLDDIEEGSAEDEIGSQFKSNISTPKNRFQEALVSTKVIQEMDNQAIRIAGFIVPLEFDDEQLLTQFLLVPFFGACLHEPPPPPNQIILVSSAQGIEIESIYYPYWVSGTLRCTLTHGELAISAYSLELAHHEDYISQ